jgi:hypothetical protein
MQLITQDQRHQLQANGVENAKADADHGSIDHHPVVKLFCPWAAASWLLTELDPDDNDIAFGLCDLGFGTPELGSVRISELEALRGPGRLSIERDLHFNADKPLSAYAEEARKVGRITA